MSSAIGSTQRRWAPAEKESCRRGDFDLSCFRDITTKAEEVALRHFGIEAARDVFEVEYRSYTKSGGERPGTFRGAAPDRDR